jgi:dihydroflavonol-4-reductase
MKVLVTGAGGHLGYNLLSALLAAGHTVRGSVRSLSDTAAVERLAALGPVEVVAATLESEPALRAAMDGMDAVVHTAAVYLLHAPGRDAEIVAASVDGVEKALRAARDARVGRVVLTSSVVTLPLTRPGALPVDEGHWAEDLRVPYFRAKTLAEKRAWELSRELGLDLVTVLPGAFAGPGFVRNTPSVDLVESIMKGAMELAAPPGAYPYVDVRDVAAAHVLALGPSAKGRYIAINDPIPSFADIAKEMHAIDRSIPRPKLTLPDFTLPLLPFLEGLNSRLTGAPRTMTPEMAATLRGRVFNATSARIRRELGWKPVITLRHSLADTITALRAQSQANAAARAVS